MGIVSYAQNFEDVLLWRALGHIKNGCYIDIGAHDPVVDSVSKAFYEHGWRGIHLEPLPVYCNALRQDRPDETVLQAAVAAETGVLRFYEIPDTGISTGDETIARSHRERGFPINEITVPCVTLAQVFELVQGDVVHWLKIDVEGLEEQVLRGWGESTLRPWVVVVESTRPLTQDEVFSTWEGLLTDKGYRWVHFDGLNRYYLAAEQRDLEAAFRCGPNVFDAFELYGTASNTFTRHVAQSLRDELGNQIETLKQQTMQHQASERDSAIRLAEENQRLESLRQALQAEQTANLQNQNAAKALALQVCQQARQNSEAQLRSAMRCEQEFSAQLLASKEQLQQLEQAHGAREKQLHEQLAQSEQQARQDSEAQLRQAMQREQAFTAQLLASKDQLQQLEQAHGAREKQLQAQLVQAERQARQDREALLLATKDQLQRLADGHAIREFGLREQLAQATHQFRLESEAHLRNAVEREQAVAAQQLALQQQAAQELAHQARELQLRHDEQRLAWQTQEKALRQEVSHLADEVYALRHANELQTQQHGFVMDARLSEHQRLLEAYAALETRFKAEIEAEQQTSLHLRQALADVQQALEKTYASLTWRLTSPLREIRNFLSGWASEDFSRVPLPQKSNSFVKTDSSASAVIVDAHVKQNNDDMTSAQVLDATHDETLQSTPNGLSDHAISYGELYLTEQTMTPILHVQDLLKLNGERMVRASYATLLGREPDAAGLVHYSMRLQRGYGRTRILAEIANSEEARIKAVDLPGLKEILREHESTRSWWRRLMTMPSRHEHSLNRLEELLDAVRENAQQIEQRFDARLRRLEAAMLALQSGGVLAPGEQAKLGGEVVQPQSFHDFGLQGRLWLKRIQSIQGRK
jgi:FkbM family methyltransferase